MATLLDSIILDERLLCDVEMVLSGGFAPLNGFLCKKDYESVIERCRLSEDRATHANTVWPMPIVLPFHKSKFKSLFGEELTIFDEFTGPDFLKLYKECNYLTEISVELKYVDEISKQLQTIAILVIEDIYEPDPEKECIGIFGSKDDNHPYIKEILERGKNYFYLGGTLKCISAPLIHYDFYDNRFTPAEIREYINNFKYDIVLGFQTRNPMHYCHYELSKNALKEAVGTLGGKSLLLLQPIVGVTQPGDVDYRVRVRCYKHLLYKYREEGINVKLCLLRLSMRMAGPREALWHALIRKNYGCTHFVVGRDHAGPSMKRKDGMSFYGAYDAHELIRKYSKEIGIEVVMSKLLVYNRTQQAYVELINTSDANNEEISGTELRRRLRNREEIPEWFTMAEISRELHRYYSPFIHALKDCNGPDTGGIVFYFVGLSGSGKSTTAYAFAKRLEEKYDPRIITVLDGDEFRTNLSAGLGYTKEDRSIHVRRMGYVASQLARQGGIVLCANIAPFEYDRIENRKIIEKYAKYVEVYVRTSLSVCEARDVKGLYKKARNGLSKEFTGISSPFEEPKNYDISILGDGGDKKLHENLNNLMKFLPNEV